MGRTFMIVLALAALDLGRADLAWDRWSWSTPRHHLFRRHDGLPIKSPQHECSCPPNKECVAQFKINEDIPEFLYIRGLLDNENFNQLKEEFGKLKDDADKASARRKRKSGSVEEECCCPPRNVLMPSFITDTKFDTINGRFSNHSSIYSVN